MLQARENKPATHFLNLCQYKQLHESTLSICITLYMNLQNL